LEAGALKPILSSLVLPPASLLLLAVLGWWLLARGRKALGHSILFVSLAALWLLSCNAVAVRLSHVLLASYPPATAQGLKAAGAQAIVVLGGGILPKAPEYGEAQLSSYTAPRIRYGVWLARATGLPLAYTGGVGWSHAGTDVPTEAVVARRAVERDYGMRLRWIEDQARDTSENGMLLGAMLRRDGITRIALVTHDFHMERSVQAFERAGLQVLPAPTQYFMQAERTVLDWLPSTGGLNTSRLALREWLGQVVVRIGLHH
jgi:uncharacterized SAM-binding protein YcdF (DUF218 family)